MFQAGRETFPILYLGAVKLQWKALDVIGDRFPSIFLGNYRCASCRVHFDLEVEISVVEFFHFLLIYVAGLASVISRQNRAGYGKA